VKKMNAKIILKKNEERRILKGHLWVFSNEIYKIEGEAENGSLVDVFDSKNNYLGNGFYNKNSLISVRILSKEKIDDLQIFFEEKILSAFQLRKEVYPFKNSYRLVFSESDFLPGLIVDKYNNTFVLQIYSFGMQMNIEKIISVLKNNLGAENIFSKNESYFRVMEGISEVDKIYLGELKTEVINDGLINYVINFEKGQKTGFYFDQNDNRFFIEKFAKDKTVLDAFCNSGGFGLHAAYAGAKSVVFVDSSAIEIENAKKNFLINNLKTEASFFTEDVFDFLEKNISQEVKYNIVMIDPPAFAKNKKSLPSAQKGYEKLNKLAIQNIESGGYLVTSSCSHHLHKDTFIEIINSASIKARRAIQLLYFNQASLDHPKLPAMEETSYLKFAVFKVL
jgi:23S rRNA (cytosine1962-C5)-methyltransferase